MKNKLLLFAFLFCTIKFSFAQLNCYQQSNGMYQYYAKLENVPILNPGFNKADFISYIAANGNMSAGNLATLNSAVTEASISFPSSQTPFLRNVANIDSNSDIYSIISNANGSISTIECRNNPILLSVQSSELNNYKLSIAPNPINEKSKLIIDSRIGNFTLSVTDLSGKIVYKNRYKNGEDIFLHSIIVEKGTYIFTVKDLERNKTASLIVIK